MPKAETPSFIVELSLQTSGSEERALRVAVEAGRMLYNACLQESLKRLRLMRESKAYHSIRQMPRDKKRSEAFKALRKHFEFKDSAIQHYGVATKNACHIGKHLDVHTVQKTASRAFHAVSMYAAGKRGHPRFKGCGQFDSLESKTNASGIKYREGWVIWQGLKIECVIDPKDKVISHSLSCPVKYCRIVRRKLNGRSRFYVQLIMEGAPCQKYEYGNETVGIDIGPSTIAYVGESKAELKQFCDELKPAEKRIRVLQRKLDRQRRASNPDNFNADGTVKAGRYAWHVSSRYREVRKELSELQRRHAAYRRALQGRLSNEVLRLGKFIKVEDLSYKSLQRIYGKSIGRRAPGLFVSSITRKAESAGGYVQKIPTKTTKLSQACICRETVKKPLSQRQHVCKCGVMAQRDLFSAFLARCVNEHNMLDTSMAQSLWTGAEPLLRQAVSRIIQSANGKALPSSFGISRRQSGSSAEACAAVGIAECEAVDVRDVVADAYKVSESPEETVLSTGTPGL
jgi:hypothetical protein